jgi:endonuclease/exonuclease/phosphatase (EEP) superfamily protein YafD
MANKGHVDACDVEARRIEGAVKRLRRAGVFNASMQLLKSERDPGSSITPGATTACWSTRPAPARAPGGATRCALEPEPNDIVELTEKQARILDSAARLVKPGGRLVYVTARCSPTRTSGKSTHFSNVMRISSLVRWIMCGMKPSAAPSRRGSDARAADPGKHRDGRVLRGHLREIDLRRSGGHDAVMGSLLERAAIALAAALALAVLGGWCAGLGLVASPRAPIASPAGSPTPRPLSSCSTPRLRAAAGVPRLAAALGRGRGGRALRALGGAAAVALFRPRPAGGAGRAGTHELRVAALNLWFRNTHVERVRQWIADDDADVLVLSEVTPELRAAIAPALEDYPWQAMSEGETRADVLLASRVPLEFVPLADGRRAPLSGPGPRLRHAGRRLHAHALRLDHRRARAVADLGGRVVHRDRLLFEIGNVAQAHRGEAVIVAGDLNSLALGARLPHHGGARHAGRCARAAAASGRPGTRGCGSRRRPSTTCWSAARSRCSTARSGPMWARITFR